MHAMKAFWNDRGQGQAPDSPIEVDLGRVENQRELITPAAR